MGTPYTYRITHLPSGKHYYGSRYAKNCHPDDLWVKYFTSSKTVKKLIEQDGKDAFFVEVRKVFNDKKSCVEWERKVLVRLGVPRNDNWLNKYSGVSLTPEEMQNAMMFKYGVPYAMQLPWVVEARKEVLLFEYGVTNISQLDFVKDKKRALAIEKYGVSCVLASPEVQKKVRSTLLDRYGVEYVTQNEEIITQIKKTWDDRYGGHPLSDPQVQEKRKKSFMDKYGVDNPSKLDSVKEKKRAKSLATYGTEHVMMSEEVRLSQAKTMISRYGFANPSQVPEFKAKIAKAISESYARRTPLVCPNCGYSCRSEANMLRYHFENCKHAKVMSLHEGGMPAVDIAKELNLSRGSITKYLKFFNIQPHHKSTLRTNT